MTAAQIATAALTAIWALAAAWLYIEDHPIPATCFFVVGIIGYLGLLSMIVSDRRS